MENLPTVWPLRFTHRSPVFGNGFVALVEFSGRLLVRQEADGVWIDGVNPGGFAVGTTGLHDAGQLVRDALTMVLIGFAEDAALVVRVTRKSTENVTAFDNPTPTPVLKAAA